MRRQSSTDFYSTKFQMLQQTAARAEAFFAFSQVLTLISGFDSLPRALFVCIAELLQQRRMERSSQKGSYRAQKRKMRLMRDVGLFCRDSLCFCGW
jgi:flagellar biosynthesis component FlhA